MKIDSYEKDLKFLCDIIRSNDLNLLKSMAKSVSFVPRAAVLENPNLNEELMLMCNASDFIRLYYFL